jgi:hypothetical protein
LSTYGEGSYGDGSYGGFTAVSSGYGSGPYGYGPYGGAVVAQSGGVFADDRPRYYVDPDELVGNDDDEAAVALALALI